MYKHCYIEVIKEWILITLVFSAYIIMTGRVW